MIGHIAGPFGLRGEVKLAVESSAVRPGLPLIVKSAQGEERALNVDAVRPHKNIFVAKLSGVDDVDAAKALQGATLLAQRSDLPPLPEGAYRACDLVGMQVIDAKQGPLGCVREVRRYPSCDMLVVGERNLLVPMLRAYEVDVKVAQREIRTKLPAGFEELA